MVSNAQQNNVPSTSNIVNNNDSTINVQPPTQFRSRTTIRRADRRRGIKISAEINSPQSTSTLNNDQPTTSATIINLDDESGQFNRMINNNYPNNNLPFINANNSSNSSSSNSSNDSSTSQLSATNNITVIKSKRQDNNIV